MQNEIYSIYHVTVEPEHFAEFRTLVSKIVAATSKELDTLTYEYVVNADHTSVHIIERYRTPGLLPHVEKTFAPFAEEFLSLAKMRSCSSMAKQHQKLEPNWMDLEQSI